MSEKLIQQLDTILQRAKESYYVGRPKMSVQDYDTLVYVKEKLKAAEELADAVSETDAHHDCGEPLESAYFNYRNAGEDEG